MTTYCAYNYVESRWSYLNRLSSVNMADDGSSLFCDDDETCEKNVSESEDDGETYVSAPIG